ncbi:MAG TPA: carbohydrate binding family 9 domain-containing protein [Bacteroidales bacterium]|nr:carbohydrate binding family 9 domain-containing protein [Bacteroidales bacterium]
MKRIRSAFLLLLLSCAAASAIKPAQDTLKPTVTAVRVEKPVQITGKLDDPQWLKAIPIYLANEMRPRENAPAKVRTEVLVLYDRDNLYIGFRCFDTLPGNIRANYSDRDKIFSDDYVIVSIDTYGNYQRGYELAVNPYGIQGDLLMMGTGNEDDSYDMVWSSAAHKNKEGWTAEMMIPFKSLSFSSDYKQKWTICFLRNVPRDNRYMLTWTRYDRNNPSYLAQGGILDGLEGIRPGSSLELLPYTMVQQSGEREDEGDPASALKRNAVKARVGGGITYSPGSNTTISAVVNPDFSQIESDAAQISVNTRFALYYPEKRPFFMSGMDLVQTPMYYSRTINDPLYAAKINGKSGRFSYLALVANDRNTAVTVPGEEESNTVTTSLDSYASVGRLRYDIGNESFIGALTLTRNIKDAYNYLGGLDWNFKFWKNWYFQGETFLTTTRELNDTTIFNNHRQLGTSGHDASFNGEKYTGTGLHLELMRAGRKYTFAVVQNNFSPTYQTYNGLFPQVNSKESYMMHRYTIHINKKYIQNIRFQGTFDMIYNFQHTFKGFSFQPSVILNMIGQTFISYSYVPLNSERFRNTLFRDLRMHSINFSTTPLRTLTINVSGQAGKFIYRTDNPVAGKGYNFTSSVDYMPFSRLKLSLMWSTAMLSDLTTGSEFYNGHIIRNITTFQFTRKLFLRGIAQYDSFGKTFSLYPLVSYRFNAFTMLCAGMTQDYQDYEQPGYRFRTSGYQYFMKLQYLFSI